MIRWLIALIVVAAIAMLTDRPRFKPDFQWLFTYFDASGMFYHFRNTEMGFGEPMQQKVLDVLHLDLPQGFTAYRKGVIGQRDSTLLLLYGLAQDTLMRALHLRAITPQKVLFDTVIVDFLRDPSVKFSISFSNDVGSVSVDELYSRGCSNSRTWIVNLANEVHSYFGLPEGYCVEPYTSWANNIGQRVTFFNDLETRQLTLEDGRSGTLQGVVVDELNDQNKFRDRWLIRLDPNSLTDSLYAVVDGEDSYYLRGLCVINDISTYEEDVDPMGMFKRLKNEPTLLFASVYAYTNRVSRHVKRCR